MPKFKVTGYAYVPVVVAMEIEAPTALIAMGAADQMWHREKKRKIFIVPKSEDADSVHSFRAAEATPI